MNENIFDKQRYYLYKGLYTLYIQENIESAKKLFIISLSQTIKDFFKQGTIPVRNIYINTEIRIILELSICELKSKNYEKAEYLLQFLLKYIESNHTDNREQKIIMPKLFYYLSLLAENNKEIENMRDYSERGIEFNMKNDVDVQTVVMSTEYYNKWKYVHPLILNIKDEEIRFYGSLA